MLPSSSPVKSQQVFETLTPLSYCCFLKIQLEIVQASLGGDECCCDAQRGGEEWKMGGCIGRREKDVLLERRKTEFPFSHGGDPVCPHLPEPPQTGVRGL